MSNYYPVFLNLLGKHCLLVGGGEVALGKVKALVGAGADLTLVAPTIHHGLLEPVLNGLRIKQRPFEVSDLDGVFLAIAATDDHGLNQRIHRLCEERGILVNVVDDTPLCNFILPSIAKEGPLQVAVSSSGTSPTMARQLRQRIQVEILKPELGDLAAFLGKWRKQINPHLPTFALKKAFWQAVMRSNLRRWLQAGNFRRAVAILKTQLMDIRENAGLPGLPPDSLAWGSADMHADTATFTTEAAASLSAIGGNFEQR